MPKYVFECDGKCKKSYSFTLGMNEEKPSECPKCGGNLIRDYKGISIDSQSMREDPNSHNYWKKGKTDDQVASVIAGEESPY